MKRPAILFLAALGLAGAAGADAVARSHGGSDAAAPERAVLAGDVVVQRSASSPDVVVAVDGGTRGQAADGIADRVFVLQRDGAPSGDAVSSYAGARVLFEKGNVLVAPADGSPAVALFLADRAALTPAAASFLGGTPVGERWTGRGIALRSGEVRVGAAGLSAATLQRVLTSCGSGTAGGAKAAGSAPCPGGGSTDCTNSTCQPLCIEGFKACCDCTPDPTNCKCSCVRE
jgi:predicted RecA/RadA family phage recombinase